MVQLPSSGKLLQPTNELLQVTLLSNEPVPLLAWLRILLKIQRKIIRPK